jgi:hypothetical protein
MQVFLTFAYQRAVNKGYISPVYIAHFTLVPEGLFSSISLLFA